MMLCTRSKNLIRITALERLDAQTTRELMEGECKQHMLFGLYNDFHQWAAFKHNLTCIHDTQYKYDLSHS